MERYLFDDLLEWKNDPRKKPLILTGARQVGKTWLMEEFGKRYFKHVVYYSFDKKSRLKELFETTIDPKEFLPMLRAEAGAPVVPGETLIIFDEIQDSPRALNSLKYFREDVPEYHVMAAGSTLGVMLHKHAPFPVGAVSFMNVYPLSFFEFLNAIGETELVKFIRENPLEFFTLCHDKLIRYMRIYMYVGGMPEAVNAYVATERFDKIRRVHKEILGAYERDFSKYAPSEAFSSKLRMLWASIPEQLGKENKKFVFGAVKPGARARDFEVAIQWMRDSSLIEKIHRIRVPKPPLKAYEYLGAFKVYLNDVGLLGAMVNVKPIAVADKFTLFTQFKGALAEQFAFQELRPIIEDYGLFYWANENGGAEVDFITSDAVDNVIPIEVKSGINLRAKSLRVYTDMFSPKYAIRTSLSEYNVNKTGFLTDMPLYAVAKIKKILEKAGSPITGEYRFDFNSDAEDNSWLCEPSNWEEEYGANNREADREKCEQLSLNL